ncbi:MAG: hypothetical protein ACLPGW_06430 [Roseiarcus sp.]
MAAAGVNLFPLLLAIALAAAAGRVGAAENRREGAAAAPATILIGQSWLGLWQDGKLVRRVDEAAWQFNAARLSADGATVEIAAYPTDALASGGDAATVMRFDRRTLALLGKVRDPSAGQWRPQPPPVGTDTPAAPEAPASLHIEAGETLVAASAAVVLTAAPAGKDGTVLQLRTADGKALGAPRRLPPGDWRAALSPDGSTVAAFVRPAAADGRAWPAEAWDAASGKAIAAPGLSIDDGASRESGAARALACLLPHGQGAIITYVGAPADSYSEYVPFGPGAGPAAPLDTPYVMSCLATGAAGANR